METLQLLLDQSHMAWLSALLMGLITALSPCPLATNIATAEALVQALDSGTLDWRNLLNPHSEYNMNKKRKV